MLSTCLGEGDLEAWADLRAWPWRNCRSCRFPLCEPKEKITVLMWSLIAGQFRQERLSWLGAQAARSWQPGNKGNNESRGCVPCVYQRSLLPSGPLGVAGPVPPTLAGCPVALGSPHGLLTVITDVLLLAFWYSSQFPPGHSFIKLHVPHIPPMQLSTTS